MPNAIKTAKIGEQWLPVAVAALCIMSLSKVVDPVVAAELLKLFAPPAGSVAPAAFLAAAPTVLMVFFPLAGFACGRLLNGVNRFVALVPVMGLSCILVIKIAGPAIAVLQPILYIGLAMFGFAFGTLANQMKKVDEQRVAQELRSTLRTRELAETRLQLIKQDEVERKMLAADLHDQVLNDLKFMMRLLDDRNETISDKVLQSAHKRLETAMDSIRNVMESLCPSDLEHIGLVAALEEVLRDRADKANFRPQFRSQVDEEELSSLNRTEKALLYRLVQESLTNVAKHAEAKKVRLTMQFEQSDELWIQVLDDGKGIPAEKANAKSRGLQYMQLRAEIIGARVNWSPGTDGKGTAVDVRINLASRKVNAPIHS